jgi:hypothetical protein
MNKFIEANELQTNKALGINTSHIIGILEAVVYTPQSNLHGVEVQCIGDKSYLIHGSVFDVLSAINGSNKV